jgi:hypothetical protein
VDVDGYDLVFANKLDAGASQRHDDRVGTERNLSWVSNVVSIPTGRDDIKWNEWFSAPVAAELFFEIDLLVLGHGCYLG